MHLKVFHLKKKKIKLIEKIIDFLIQKDSLNLGKEKLVIFKKNLNIIIHYLIEIL